MRRIAVALLVLASGCSRSPGHAGAGLGGTREERREIWAILRPAAETRGVDAGFVYALVSVESGFNPRASHGDNRGLLQLKPRLWQSVSARPYDPGVWDPRESLEVGIDVLAAMKARLERKGVFSYPLLWACYHYGEDFVAARGHDMSRIPRPSDPVAERLWSGEIHPIDPPN